MTQKAEPSWGLRGGEEGICCWRRAEGIKDMMLADEHRASPDQTVAESWDAPGPWPLRKAPCSPTQQLHFIDDELGLDTVH